MESIKPIVGAVLAVVSVVFGVFIMAFVWKTYSIIGSLAAIVLSAFCIGWGLSVMWRVVREAWQADETTTGPASFMAVDPDGNPILVDQHV